MAMIVTATVVLWILGKVSKVLMGGLLIALFMMYPVKTAVVLLILLVLQMPT